MVDGRATSLPCEKPTKVDGRATSLPYHFPLEKPTKVDGRATKSKFTNAANVIQVRVFHVKAPQWWMEGPPVYHVKNPQRWMEGPPKASCCQVMSFLEANMPISIQRKAPNTVVTSGSKVKPVNPKQIRYLNNTTFAFLVFLPGWYDG